jgi:hypothetical protein
MATRAASERVLLAISTEGGCGSRATDADGARPAAPIEAFPSPGSSASAIGKGAIPDRKLTRSGTFFLPMGPKLLIVTL